MRTRKSQSTALFGVLLAGVLASGCATNAEAAPAQPPGPPDSVGSNPAVQRWFKRHEAERIAVNDALQKAYLQLGNAPGAGNGCAELKAVAEAMLAALPTPKRALDSLVVSGVTQFRDAAVQCLAGDAAGARRLLEAGAQARADADNAIEEILEAPNGRVK